MLCHINITVFHAAEDAHRGRGGPLQAEQPRLWQTALSGHPAHPGGPSHWSRQLLCPFIRGQRQLAAVKGGAVWVQPRAQYLTADPVRLRPHAAGE